MATFLIILIVLTIAYAFVSSYTDLRKRTLYTTPGWGLSLLWLVYELISLREKMTLTKVFLPFLIILGLIWFFFNIRKIWGAGDSDFLVLFGLVLFTALSPANILAAAFMLITGMTVSLFSALIISLLEALIRKKKFGLDTGAAVIPGFATVLAIMLIKFLQNTLLIWI